MTTSWQAWTLSAPREEAILGMISVLGMHATLPEDMLKTHRAHADAAEL